MPRLKKGVEEKCERGDFRRMQKKPWTAPNLHFPRQLVESSVGMFPAKAFLTRIDGDCSAQRVTKCKTQHLKEEDTLLSSVTMFGVEFTRREIGGRDILWIVGILLGWMMKRITLKNGIEYIFQDSFEKIRKNTTWKRNSENKWSQKPTLKKIFLRVKSQWKYKCKLNWIKNST